MIFNVVLYNMKYCSQGHVYMRLISTVCVAFIRALVYNK